MAELLAAPPDPRNDWSRIKGTRRPTERKHVQVGALGGCGTRIDQTRTSPAADVPEADRCRASGCRHRWPP